MSIINKPGLIVHAGMPKTGTKTIQTAFGRSDWADVLAARRIRYLVTDGVADGDVKNHSGYLNSQVGRPAWVSEAEHTDRAGRFAAALRDCAESLPPGWVGLVSAESLFDIARDISSLSCVSSLLRRHFQVVSVPVYVREPLSYASSRVQQGLKNAYPLEVCLRNVVFQLDMMTSIRNLEVVFGGGCVRVRSYDRVLLDSGDVLWDFAVHMLGLEPSAALEKRIRTHHSQNFSLTNEILEPLVDFYARRCVAPSDIKKCVVVDRLSNVRWSGRPYNLDKVPAEFMLPIVEAADHSRTALCAHLRYDCFPSFESNTSGVGPAPARAALAASIENIETLTAMIRVEYGAAGESLDLPISDSIERAQARVRELLEVLYDHC